VICRLRSGLGGSRTCRRTWDETGVGKVIIHLTAEAGRRPLAFVITPGRRGDAPQLIPVLERGRVPRLTGGPPRTRPDHLGGDKHRNEVERTINALRLKSAQAKGGYREAVAWARFG